MDASYDPRVDLVLLFVSGDGLSASDAQLLRDLTGLVPVLPVVAKVRCTLLTLCDQLLQVHLLVLARASPACALMLSLLLSCAISAPVL